MNTAQALRCLAEVIATIEESMNQMQATVDTRRLTAALADLSRVIYKKPSVLVLNHVLFDGSGGVSATDLDVTLRIHLGAPDHAPFVAPYAALQKAIKGADKGSVASITSDGETVRIECDGMTTTTAAAPISEYPVPTDPDGQSDAWWVDAGDLRAILEYMAPCIADEETRYYLNGVCFRAQEGALDVVATDGFKLALFRTGLRCADLESIAPAGVIMPHKAVKVALAMLAKTKSAVRLTAFASHVRIESEDWTLDAKAIAGTFPNYLRVIPQGVQNTVTVDRAVAIKSIERVAATSESRPRVVRLDMSDDHARVTLVESGSTSSSMGFSCRTDGEMSALFNADYLLDVFKVAPGDSVTMGQNGTGDPALVTCPTDDRLSFVVMPRRR